MKNKYVTRSRISEKKFKDILKYFTLDLQANQISEITGLSRNSVNSYIKAIRVAIAGQNKIDGSYTHEYVQRCEHLLFGLKQQNQKICIDKIPGTLNEDIYRLVKAKNNMKNRDTLDVGYNSVIDFTGKKLYQLQDENHPDIKHLETSSFWGYTKIRLTKFRGISGQNIYLHLKECEYRYNHRDQDLYKLMLTHFRNNPLEL